MPNNRSPIARSLAALALCGLVAAADPAPVIKRIPAEEARQGVASDGRLAISGHDRPEIYLLTLPEAGSVLRLDSIVAIASEGQAIDWDPARPTRLWSISRATRELVLSDFRSAPRNR